MFYALTAAQWLRIFISSAREIEMFSFYHKTIVEAAAKDATIVAIVEKHFCVKWIESNETFAQFCEDLSEVEACRICEDSGLTAEEMTAADAREGDYNALRARMRTFLR